MMAPGRHLYPLTKRRVASAIAALAFASGLVPSSSNAELAETWQAMVNAEETILTLTKQTKALARSIRNLRVPDRSTRGLFTPTVSVSEIDVDLHQAETIGTLGDIREVHAKPEPQSNKSDHLDIWVKAIGLFDSIDYASFGFLDGRFAPDNHFGFLARLKFDFAGTLSDGTRAGAHGVVDVEWIRTPEQPANEVASWKIRVWHTQSFKILATPAPLFREVLSEVVIDREALKKAQTSKHEQYVLDYIRKGDAFETPHKHFFPPAQDRHPAVSVVDINRDGHDDVYVMPRWGRNLLFVNNGSGSFDERAAEYGLDITDHSTSAIFADFDNDGDSDAFVGRSLAPSVYLENIDGRFVDKTESKLLGNSPRLVTSVSAADYNNDGLLDLYVATYAASLIDDELRVLRPLGIGPLPKERTPILAEHLPEKDADGLARRIWSDSFHQIRALPGPPNRLLKNAGGGRLEPVEHEHSLNGYWNTYQATWADFDSDGDVDVYVANDFLTNAMFRNDGEAGFTDVTDQTSTRDIGFGMGASWGDYDRDGHQDLYVSNMYSKAGGRIVRHFDDMDDRFKSMARGNSLFRNAGTTFNKVSGRKSPDLTVEIAGWSWGGQFADFNNDGNLDIYTASGYYSAPRQVELAVDL